MYAIPVLMKSWTVPDAADVVLNLILEERD